MRGNAFRASAKSFVRLVAPESRHSGERRNPGISIPRAPGLDPGFRRGDDQGGQSVSDKIMDNCYTLRGDLGEDYSPDSENMTLAIESMSLRGAKRRSNLQHLLLKPCDCFPRSKRSRDEKAGKPRLLGTHGMAPGGRLCKLFAGQKTSRSFSYATGCLLPSTLVILDKIAPEIAMAM